MVKTITIVSLSSGIIGEKGVQHEAEIGIRRLEEYGIKLKFATHARDGLETLKRHPEYRAQDLIEALRDKETDMILCAIGGDDTYRLLPYLFDNGELRKAVVGSKKIFLGFSDTTINHFMLHKVGLNTFYGQAFFPDVCELDNEMLPYSRLYFEQLLRAGTIREIHPSEVWYEERTDYSVSAVGTRRVQHLNDGFNLLQGAPVFGGEILGGCIDTIYDIFDNGRYADSAEMCQSYGVFPDIDEWNGRILLLESSEEQTEPEKYRKMLEELKKTRIFDVISGVIVGKPMDEKYAPEYYEALVSVIDNPDLPIVTNVNIGHATPRCIIPFGVRATVDVTNQVIRFEQ